MMHHDDDLAKGLASFDVDDVAAPLTPTPAAAAAAAIPPSADIS